MDHGLPAVENRCQPRPAGTADRQRDRLPPRLHHGGDTQQSDALRRLPVEGSDPDLDGGTGQEPQHNGGGNAQVPDEPHHLVGALAQAGPVVASGQLSCLREQEERPRLDDSLRKECQSLRDGVDGGRPYPRESTDDQDVGEIDHRLGNLGQGVPARGEGEGLEDGAVEAAQREPEPRHQAVRHDQAGQLADQADGHGDDAERDEPAVQLQDDDPSDGLGHRHGDQAVVQEVEPLECVQRAAERVHGYGERHVERQEEKQELPLADQALGDGGDDLGQEVREDQDASERNDPEHRQAQEGRVERCPHLVVVIHLEMPADEGHRGIGKAQLEDLEERNERADERPDPVAEYAQLMREDGRGEEPDAGQDDGAYVARDHIAAMAGLLRLPSSHDGWYRYVLRRAGRSGAGLA